MTLPSPVIRRAPVYTVGALFAPAVLFVTGTLHPAIQNTQAATASAAKSFN
jgi:hypothetical protein